MNWRVGLIAVTGAAVSLIQDEIEIEWNFDDIFSEQRHTFCTRCADAGLDIKVLQMIMGHSDISITMNIYNHVDAARVQNEIKKLENIM